MLAFGQASCYRICMRFTELSSYPYEWIDDWEKKHKLTFTDEAMSELIDEFHRLMGECMELGAYHQKISDKSK